MSISEETAISKLSSDLRVDHSDNLEPQAQTVALKVGQRSQCKNPTDAKAPNNLDTFTFFQRLPAEIRLNIYQHTPDFNRPQLIHGIAPVNLCEAYPLTVLRTNSFPTDQYSGYAPPIALSVNYELRQEALRTYVLWKATNLTHFQSSHSARGSTGTSSIEVYVNPKVDIFVFGLFDFQLSEYGLTQNPLSGELVLSHHTPESALDHFNATFGVIQHIGILTSTWSNAAGSERHDFIMFLRHFSKLETLTIVIDYDPDIEDISPEEQEEKPRKGATVREVGKLVRCYLEQLTDRVTEDHPMKPRPKVKLLVLENWRSKRAGVYDRFCSTLPIPYVPPQCKGSLEHTKACAKESIEDRDRKFSNYDYFFEYFHLKDLF